MKVKIKRVDEGLPLPRYETDGSLGFDILAREVTTIEGLEGPDGTLHPLQQAFIDHGAIQCGFCTPGMVLSAKALLDENPKPTEMEVKQAIAGNL